MGPDNLLKEESLIFSPNVEEVILGSEFFKDLGVLIDAELPIKSSRIM